MKSIFSPTNFINIFSNNLRNSPFSGIKDLVFFNIVIFFIYNIRRTTSPGTDRRVGSPQSIHTILVLTLNYHVFLTTVAFCNTYPNQPYTSHALHAISGSNGLYSSVLGIHFTTRVTPTTVRRSHNKGVSKFWVDTDGETENLTTLSPTRKNGSDTIKEGRGHSVGSGNTVILQ